MWGYYFFFTLYMIPHNALIPELIRDGPLRVNAYTVSSFFFVTGSALGYVSPLIVSLFKSAGLATLWAWRTTFGIYTLIGIILLMIPACPSGKRTTCTPCSRTCRWVSRSGTRFPIRTFAS